jgi:TDG/mug DNA glycosylase family protein
MRSAATGHHFAGYSNRFWKLLYESRLVPERIGFEDDCRLPEWGFGITNLVRRPTRSIEDLAPSEYRDGRRALVAKVRRLRPEIVVLVGVTVHRALFRQSRTTSPLGLRAEAIGGVPVFVLPNPSGRNANYSYERMLAAYRSLRRWIERPPRTSSGSLRAPVRTRSEHPR